MQNFVLAGKAKTVFRIIELKAKREVEEKRAKSNKKVDQVKREAELEAMMQRDKQINDLRTTANQCRISKEAKCTKPLNISCKRFGCPIWIEKYGLWRVRR